MTIARTIALRVNEIRLQQAIDEAHRAKLAFLREDLFDGDCERCARKVRLAEARADRLEATLRALRESRESHESQTRMRPLHN
jgi:hypothetical protein